MTGDPLTGNEMQDEINAEKGSIERPGGVQQDSADAFEAIGEDEARADIPDEPPPDVLDELRQS